MVQRDVGNAKGVGGKEESDETKGVSGSAGGVDGKRKTGKDVSKDDGKVKKKDEMILWELFVGGLTSLLLVAMLLTIYVSGLLCLVNIQTPATFDKQMKLLL